MSPRLHWRALGVALLAAGLAGGTVARAAGPDPLSLSQLTGKAGIIFSGRVLRVERLAPAPGRLPLVQVSFQVERALRGARPGHTFILMQWAGGWDNGPQYRPGQRLLLFLYPPGPAGLSSVVGGRLGQFEVDSGGNIVIRADQQRFLSPQSADRPPAALGYRDFARRVRRAAAE